MTHILIKNPIPFFHFLIEVSQKSKFEDILYNLRLEHNREDESSGVD